MNDRDFLLDLKTRLDAQLSDTPTPPPGDPCTTLVKALYLAELKRDADDGGLAYWVGECRAGMPEANIRAALHAAYIAEHPTPTGVDAMAGVVGLQDGKPFESWEQVGETVWHDFLPRVAAVFAYRTPPQFQPGFPGVARHYILESSQPSQSNYLRMWVSTSRGGQPITAVGGGPAMIEQDWLGGTLDMPFFPVAPDTTYFLHAVLFKAGGQENFGTARFGVRQDH